MCQCTARETRIECCTLVLFDKVVSFVNNVFICLAIPCFIGSINDGILQDLFYYFNVKTSIFRKSRIAYILTFDEWSV